MLNSHFGYHGFVTTIVATCRGRLDNRFDLAYVAIMAMIGVMTAKEIIEALGVSRPTLDSWLGEGATRPRNRSGG